MIGEARPSPDAYSPIEDPAVPLAEFADRFMTWISSYFQPFTDLHAITPSALEQRKDMIETSSNPAHTPTTSRMPSADLHAATYPAVFARNPTPMPNALILQIYGQNYRQALFDTKGTWSNVSVLVLWGDMSPMYFPWAVKVMGQDLAVPTRAGEQRRSVRLQKMENATHFVIICLFRFEEYLLTIGV